MKQQINVQGMTCEHCVKAVAEELSAVTGVTDVQINLVADGTSTVVVETDQTLTDEQIRAALSQFISNPRVDVAVTAMRSQTASVSTPSAAG